MFNLLNPPALFIEIGRSSWFALNGDDFMEFPVERLDDAALTAALRHFVNKKGWAPRRRAVVAIGAGGVSLRRLALPPAPQEELPRLLRMQIESEFPLPPEELAWGWQWLGQEAGRQPALVAAVKKDLLQPVSQILAACGITPVFTLAALACSALYPKLPSSCAVLRLGATESELLTFQEGAPSSVRLVLWGAESAGPPPASVSGPIYLTGATSVRLPNSTALELGGDKRSAVLAGLQKYAADGNGLPPLVIQTSETKTGPVGIVSWKWAAAAVFLALALLGFPYAEAILLKPHLAHKLAAIQSARDRLPAIDHELEFLQYLKRSQPPYLDTIYLIAKVAPPGTSFESLSMTRRGEFSVRGKLQNAQQVTEFRSNLIASAWFSSVVVEEQTPTPDRQVTVRMSAQVKPVDSRKPITVDLPPSETPTNSVKSPKPSKT